MKNNTHTLRADATLLTVTCTSGIDLNAIVAQAIQNVTQAAPATGTAGTSTPRAERVEVGHLQSVAKSGTDLDALVAQAIQNVTQAAPATVPAGTAAPRAERVDAQSLQSSAKSGAPSQ